MSETFDFNAYLERSSDDVKRPRPLPAGTYTFMVKDKKFGQSDKKKTPFVEFTILPQAADADVDPVALADFNLHEKEMRATFYLTKDAEYRLLDFAKACGVNTTGRKLMEVITSCVNCFVKGAVKVRPNDQDPTAPGYNDVGPYSSAA